MALSTLEQGCQDRILELVPLIRQINANTMGDHHDYVVAVITLLRKHYYDLVDAQATVWTDPDQATMDWIINNRPYNI